MATANDLITAALRRCKAFGRDQVIPAEDAADGLAELNRMLDDLWNERLAVFHIKQESFALVAGTKTYTIGTGGTFNTTRPLDLLDGCFVRRNGVDTMVAMPKDRALFDNWPVKTVQGLLQAIYYDADYPLANILCRPVPDQADTLFINSPAQLQNVAALVTPLLLPPGYGTLLLAGLAIRLAPEYGLEAPLSVKTAYARAIRNLKRTNTISPVSGFDNALLPRSAVWDIYSGVGR